MKGRKAEARLDARKVEFHKIKDQTGFHLPGSNKKPWPVAPSHVPTKQHSK